MHQDPDVTGAPLVSQAFAANMRAAREDANLSQRDLAARVGLDPSAVTRIESGKRAVRVEEAVAIAAALGRTVDWMVRDPKLIAGEALALELIARIQRAHSQVVNGGATLLWARAQMAEIEKRIAAGGLEVHGDTADLVRNVKALDFQSAIDAAEDLFASDGDATAAADLHFSQQDDVEHGK